MKLIELNLNKIFALCAKHKVAKLFVFGSILTPQFNSDSDIDLVVDFKDISLEEYVDNYLELKEGLSQLLGREIDLLEENGIRNRMLRNNIDRTKKLIYG